MRNANLSIGCLYSERLNNNLLKPGTHLGSTFGKDHVAERIEQAERQCGWQATQDVNRRLARGQLHRDVSRSIMSLLLNSRLTKLHFLRRGDK